MCGIIGAFGANVSKDKINKGLKKLVHRGPDGEGLFEDQNCVLGHRRLSIIDLKTGSQPMASDCGRYIVIFNGEIYNYKELKNNLTLLFF